MKTILLRSSLLLSALLLSIGLQAQDEIKTDRRGRIVFEYSDTFDLTQNQLYDLAREWFVEAFVSSESVIELENKESGKVWGKAKTNVQLSFATIADLDYTIKFRAGDSMINFAITGMQVTIDLPNSNISSSNPLKEYMELKKKAGQKAFVGAKEHADGLYADLVNYITEEQ